MTIVDEDRRDEVLPALVLQRRREVEAHRVRPERRVEHRTRLPSRQDSQGQILRQSLVLQRRLRQSLERLRQSLVLQRRREVDAHRVRPERCVEHRTCLPTRARGLCVKGHLPSAWTLCEDAVRTRGGPALGRDAGPSPSLDFFLFLSLPRARARSLALSFSFSLSLARCVCHTHTHALSRSLPLSPTISLCHSRSLSLGACSHSVRGIAMGS